MSPAGSIGAMSPGAGFSPSHGYESQIGSPAFNASPTSPRYGLSSPSIFIVYLSININLF